MPQLDTVYIFMIYLWTWFTLYLIMQKTKTLLIIKPPKSPTHKGKAKRKMTLPWT